MMGEWVDRLMDEWVDRWRDEWVKGWVDEWVDGGRMMDNDRQTQKSKQTLFYNFCAYVFKKCISFLGPQGLHLKK